MLVLQLVPVGGDADVADLLQSATIGDAYEYKHVGTCLVGTLQFAALST